MTSQDTIIKITDFNLYYSAFHALKNVNLDIRKNSITALIGSSGCGKTSLLRTINRMNDLIPECRNEGTILFGDTDILKEPDLNSIRTHIGMVFQKPNPFPFSIWENIAYGPKAHGIKKKAELQQIVRESLTGAGLWDEVKDRLNSNALGLSGGQQQRLCIARALAVKPQVLLMDEPTSALDPISTARIEDLVMELKKKFTIVMVTHNMQQALRIADRTAFFLLGEIVEENDTQELFSRPQDKRTEDYITGRFG